MNLKDLQNSLDLSKTDYKINKNFFRVMMIIMIVCVVVSGFVDGFDTLITGSAGMCCRTVGGCNNPFYSPLSVDPWRGDPIIENGVCVGDPEPSLYTRILGSLILLIIVTTFLFNHLLYNKGYFKKKRQEGSL